MFTGYLRGIGGEFNLIYRNFLEIEFCLFYFFRYNF